MGESDDFFDAFRAGDHRIKQTKRLKNPLSRCLQQDARPDRSNTGRLLEKCYAMPLAGQHQRRRTSADTAPDDAD
jgi:hypothetical protein